MIVKRICIWSMILLIVCMPLTVFAESSGSSAAGNNDTSGSTQVNSQTNLKEEADKSGNSTTSDAKTDYYDFLASHSGDEQPAAIAEAISYQPASGNKDIEYNAEVQGKKSVYLKSDGAAASWNITIGKAGLYALRMEYILQMENTLNARFSLYINGKSQYSSMGLIKFPQRFKNKTAIRQDVRGNDVRPTKTEIIEWDSWIVDNPEVEIYGAMLVYLNQGVNILQVKAELGGVAIGRLEALNYGKTPVYSEYVRQNNSIKNSAPDNYYWVRQAEDCGNTSDSVLYPTYDRSCADTVPNDPSKLRLNTIGQSSWNTPGQWIEWEIEVPSDGYYEIGMRVRQNELRGFFSTRTITIDGKLLFDELKGVQFPYSLNWYVKTLGDKNNYLFYLTEGKHTLRMKAAQGTVAESINELENLTLDLNTLYRNIIMVTGLFIDTYRDYMLEQQIPNLKGRLINIRDRLQVQMRRLASLGVRGGSDAVVLEKLIYQLNSFNAKPESIPERVDDFLSNISSMSAWALAMKNQPLEIDYIYVKSPSVAEPKASTGLWTQVWFKTRALFSSYFEDYSSLSGLKKSTGSPEKIKVWVALGRDQGQIIKDLSDNYFTPADDISIDLALMQTGLNEAIAAGRGPDVALFTGDVVNLASREALADISKYKDFGKLSSRFCRNALTPYTYKGGVYGIPLEQNVLMMFYRTDVLSELGLKAPATWGEFNHVLTTLEKNRLSAGLYAGSSTAGDTSIFELLLYQMGGSLFNKDLTATDLGSDKCYKAFKQWTDYYVKYSLLTEFNFFNRFRSGEMPIGIQAQNMYATLRLAAPEMDGLWRMAPVPQTILKDGTASDISIGSVSPAIVLKNKKAEACFRFLDWFTSADVQVSYGKEVENILGMGARYNSANLEAVSKLNWAPEESRLLVSQMKKTYITPVIPASYYIGRNLTNAFRKVVIKGYTPRESLLIYNKIINSEIKRKNDELARRAAKSK